MRTNRWLPGVLCFLAFCVAGCGTQADKPKNTKEPESAVNYEKGVDFVGAVRTVDTDSGMIEFYNTSFETTEMYPYTGGTRILTKNDKEMTASEIEPGDVYDVYTSEDGKKIEKMKQSSDITVHEGVSMQVNADAKYLTIRGVNYAYSSNLIVLSDGEQVDPMEITPEDEVTFRGVKGQAFSVIVTRGHGYIQPTNCKDFTGGTVTVQGEAILPVAKDMLLVVPEGSRLLSMTNGDLTAEVSVQVKRGQVTRVDISKYQSQVPDTSRVKFDVNPQGAELYVNGALTDPSQAISLKYGNHSVKVVLEGYSSYSGIISVQDASLTVHIDLAEEKAEVDTGEESTDSSVSESESESSSSSSTAVTYDTDHNITVSAPVGAAVYVNGTYKGEVPCSFSKMIGSLTLSLTKSGYETKTYSVEIADDSKDISWTFPDLEKED